MTDKSISQLELEIARLKKINNTLTQQVEGLIASNGQAIDHRSVNSHDRHSDAPLHLIKPRDSNTKTVNSGLTDIDAMQISNTQTSINDVMGMMEMMLDSPAEEGSESLIETFHNSEVSLLTVINDILDFSKMKSGKLSLRKEAFNLLDIFNTAIEKIEVNAQKKNIKLITLLPQDIEYEVIGDASRLRQILVNLLSNAVKFTDNGVIEFTASLNIENAIVNLEVTVRDTGKGIDAAQQKSIFEPFEQEGDVNEIKDFAGTGLGLSITRDLINLMTGEISLKSVVGEGSTFTFNVELGIGNKIGVSNEKYDDSEIRILLAEDTLANQEIMYEQMDILGYKIEIVENGLQALEAISQNSYALIFMDIHMPYMDGFAATEAIREVEKEQNRKPVPIIAVTADLSRDVQLRCEQVGMNNYLSKPFAIDDIEEILKTWISHDETGQSQLQSIDVTPILSSPKDLSRAVIEQLRALSEHGDNDTLGSAVNHLNLAYTILFTLQKTRNANALWQHQQLLEAAEHTAQVSHWSWEPNKQHIQFSRHLQRYFETSIADIKTLDSFIETIGDLEMKVAIEACLNGGQDSSWEQEIVNDASSEPRYLLHRFRIVSSEDKSPMLIGTVQEISSIRRAEQRIMELAFYDSLTKLSSRSSFNKQLQELIVSSHRRVEKFAVLYLDVDDFKNINDSFGHEVGDSLLIEVANRLRNLLRESDFASRLGGDEFCMLINDIKNKHSAENVAKRCLELLSKPFMLEGREIIPNASIGIAIYPQDGNDANVLIKAADTAMYEAKKKGKKQYMLYDVAMTAAAQHRLTIEDDLKAALAEQQFELYYQPKISLSTGKLESVEALIRWNHPENGLRSPDAFIPDAERLGLISQIGEWVVRQACSQIKAWKQQGLDDIAIAVNISPLHFEDKNFAKDLSKLVKDAGVSPSLIEVEITESTSRNQSVFLDTCQHLRKLGFRTAIDDFGTGYSSLSSLKDAAVDVLKIDREFIRHLPNDSQASVLVGTILGMSKALGLKVVAEGVETEEQLKVLVSMGCHIAQGYYFSKPVRSEKIPEITTMSFRRPKENRVA